MKVVWAILCKSAVTDQISNQVSLFNVIDELTIHGALPVAATEPSPESTLVPVDAELIVLWARSDPDTPEDGHGRVRLVGPNQSEVLLDEVVVDLKGTFRARWFHHWTDFPYLHEGEYLLKLDGKSPDSDWQELFELPLRVVIQTQDSP